MNEEIKKKIELLCKILIIGIETINEEIDKTDLKKEQKEYFRFFALCGFILGFENIISKMLQIEKIE